MDTPRGARSRHDMSPRKLLLFALLTLVGLIGSANAQSLSPGGPVDFGTQNLGTTSSATTLTFSVPPTTVTTVGSIVAVTDGTGGKDFNVASQTCVGTLAGPTTCQIVLTFTPSVLGLRLGELLVKDSAGAVTNRVPLRGAGLGPQMVVSPATGVATTSLSGISPGSIQPSSTVYDGSGNLFIDDAINGRILERDSVGNVTVVGTLPAAPASAPFSSIAIAGDGTLYISSPSTGAIYSLVPGGAITPLSTPGVTLVKPAGLAADGYGYLYVADAGTNSIVRINLESSNQATVLSLTGLGTPLSSPEGITIDDSATLYVADTANNRVVSINLHTTTSFTNAATVLSISGATLSLPTAVVVNAAGGLTIADTGNSRLVERPITGPAFPIALTGATLSAPAGINLLPTGDLLVSDTLAGLVQITRTTGSITFPTSTLVGTVDTTDGDIAVDVENTGSYPLTIPEPGSGISNGAFFADTTSTCPFTGSAQAQVAVGTACTLEMGFKPTVKGTNSGTLTISASGGTGNFTASVTLTGIGYVVLDHFNLNVTPSTVTPGQATTLTVTAINNDGSVDTTYAGTITLSCTDPACKLPTVTYTFTPGDSGTHVFPSTSGAPLNFNTLGNWTVTAVDGKYNGTSNVVTVITTPTIALTSSVNPVGVGASTVLTATLTSAFGTPGGSVTFYDGSVALGMGTLNASGVATLTVSFSAVGQHPLTANFPGSGFFQAATSTTLIENVQDYTPTIALTSSVNPINVGGSTTLTVTLASTTGTPTGTVTFFDGTTALGTSTLSGGVASFSASFSAPGQHPLTATYSGDGTFKPVTSATLIETVQSFTPAIVLTSSVNPVLRGNSTVLTVTLTSPAGTPTGSVTFMDGTTTLGTVALSNGVATLSVSFSTVGQHTLTATYGGGGFYQGATSAPLVETVEDFSIALASGAASSASAILGGKAAYNLVVAPVGGSKLAGTVAMTVSGLPSGATYSFAPSTVPSGNGNTPVVLTINAPPVTSGALHRPVSPVAPAGRGDAPAMLALLLLPVGFLARRRKSLGRLLILLVGLGAAASGLTGCVTNDTTGFYGQNPQTYTLTITGTSGSLVHTVQVKFTVE